jgi:hypothetical protein
VEIYNQKASAEMFIGCSFFAKIVRVIDRHLTGLGYESEKLTIFI